MVSSGDSADQSVSSDKLQQRLSSHSGIEVSQEIDDDTIHSSKTEGATSIPFVVAEEVENSNATACALQQNQEGNSCSLPIENALRSPEIVPRALQSSLDSPSLIREMVSKDGYNWRKYGQKHVKGNEFIRSYYKCTNVNCQAKKQLELSNNGQITDTICIGQHNHPRPQLNASLPVDFVAPVEAKPIKPSFANADDKAFVEQGCVPQEMKPHDPCTVSTVSPIAEVKAAHSQSTRVKDEIHNNEDPESKRLKKDNCNADFTGIDKSTGESRVVVKTLSEVDLVNDGYRWRKYGQKLVKGNPNPRSYYRCSNIGCPAKKHVERASHDSNIVITTYEGLHDHEMTPGRTVDNNFAEDSHIAADNGKSGTKSEGTVGIDTGKHACLDSEGRLNKQLNGKTSTKPEAGDMVGFCVTTSPSEGLESNSIEHEQQNKNSGTENNSVSLDVISHTSSKVPCKSKEQLKDNVRSESEGRKDDCLDVVAVRDTPDLESNINKKPTSDVEPAES